MSKRSGSEESETSGPATAAPAAGDGGSGLQEQSLEKIREILFGERVRVQEERLLRIEESMLRELQGVRADVQRRSEALEVRVRKDLGEIERKLLESERDGILGREQLVRDIEVTRRHVEERVAELAQRSEKNVEFIQEHVAAENRTLRDSLQRKQDELAQAIERAIAELRAEKVDRVALAGVFGDLAARLNDSAKKLRNE